VCLPAARTNEAAIVDKDGLWPKGEAGEDCEQAAALMVAQD